MSNPQSVTLSLTKPNAPGGICRKPMLIRNLEEMSSSKEAVPTDITSYEHTKWKDCRLLFTKPG